MSFWALPRPEASSVASASAQSVDEAPLASTSKAAPPAPRNGRYKRREPSPFLPKQNNRFSTSDAASMSSSALEQAIERTEASLRRAGTSAASAVLEKRLTGLRLEQDTRRLRSSSLGPDEGDKGDVQQRLARMHLKEEASPRLSQAEAARPRIPSRAKIGSLDWEESQRLLQEDWRRDQALRQAAEEAEAKQFHAPRLRGAAAAAKQEALQQFMFSGAADDDESDADSDEIE